MGDGLHGIARMEEGIARMEEGIHSNTTYVSARVTSLRRFGRRFQAESGDIENEGDLRRAP